MPRSLLIVLLVVLFLRVPFLNQAIQGDDVYYLAGAQHALIDPAHPNHTQYIFRGEVVDMRGHPHPPLVSWILAALVAIFGDIREVPFHAVFAIFSLIAAWAVWWLARRFGGRPLEAALLFIAVPAFVVNGNSFEADVPFAALWLAAVALFVKAVDANGNEKWLAASGIVAALAALTAYQAVLLTPILAFYVWMKRRHCVPSWATTLAAPAAILLWNIYERSTSGTLPAAVLGGYLNSHGFQAASQKLKSAVALVVHFAWMVCPVLLALVARRLPRWALILAGLAAVGGMFYDPNPLFWVSLGISVAGLLWFASPWIIRRPRDRSNEPASELMRTSPREPIGDELFLYFWICLFFAAAVILFFAGSARYLLPLAAPVAILISRELDRTWLLAGFAAQIVLSLGLSVVSYQHWNAYRELAQQLAPLARTQRVWVNGEWGLRHYLEAEGALPLAKGQPVRPGDTIVTSLLSQSFPNEGLLSLVSRKIVSSGIPLRMVSLHGKSAFSVAATGLRPFDVSLDDIDEIRVETVQERHPALESLRTSNANAASQIVRGLFPDGWTAGEAVVLLKRPDRATALRAMLTIPAAAAARHVELLLDGELVLENTFDKPGSYTISTGILPRKPGESTIVLRVDKTVRVPPDQRDLGILLSEIGFTK